MTQDLKTKIAEAIQRELRRQGVLYEEGGSLANLMLDTGAVADLPRVIEAALQAIHDAGFAVVPRPDVEVRVNLPLLKAHCQPDAGLAQYGTLRSLAYRAANELEQYRQASQPKTEEG